MQTIFDDYVKKISRHFEVDVDLAIVYTDSFRSEAIVVDDKTILVHDRYLGQALNMLNRLFLYKASGTTICIYLHKLVSHIFSRYGFYPEAIFAGRIYVSDKKKMDHKRKQKNRTIHGMYTQIQELFVMLHENAHALLNKQPNIIDDIANDVRKWILTYGEVEDDIENSFDKLLTSNISEEDKQIYKASRDEIVELGKARAAYCKQIAKRKDLIAELSCDRLAILHMMPYFFKQHTIKSEDFIKAVLLCLLHLRSFMLAELRCSVEHELEFTQRSPKITRTEDIYTTFYNARLHHIKDFCYMMFQLKGEQFHKIHDMVSSLMDEHSDLILAPILNLTNVLLYDPGIRERMDLEFKFIQGKMPEGQTERRFVSAMLWAVA
jgi:hypothetical protein